MEWLFYHQFAQSRLEPCPLTIVGLDHCSWMAGQVVRPGQKPPSSGALLVSSDLVGYIRAGFLLRVSH
jgi:hypothetical protein